jgi:hypothetical protein
MCPKQIGGIANGAEVGRTGAPISTAESQEETHPGLSSNPASERNASPYTINGEPRIMGSRTPGRFVAKGSPPGTASALVCLGG